jgi:hypothetical protein
VALETSERALERSRQEESHGDEAWIVWLLAEIHASSDSPNLARSEPSYREALAAAAELGMRPLVAHCHLGLGKLYRRTDRREQAQEHLATATTMYREMGMTYWLEKAEPAVRELA